MGVYFLKNLLSLRVSLLEPNAITLYCLVLGSAWTTMPLRSQRFSLLPSWFCSMTWSTILTGGSSLVPCFSVSWRLVPLGANASSLQSAPSFQVSLMSLWLVMCALGFVPGRKSRRSWPRSICAGDMPVSWSGVFLRVSSPFTSGIGSSSPLGLMESLITLFADPTDLSAFWLAWGNPTEVSLWRTPSFLRNSCRQCTQVPHQISMSPGYRSCGSTDQAGR
jgi:hypothetical protein